MIGHQAIDFYAEPKARQAVVDTIRRTGTIYNYETLLKRADGSTFWALFSATQATFNNEQVILAGIIDISERKQIEEKLIKSERLYRLLAENTQDVIWSLDTESMRFTYISPSIEQLQGSKPEEIIGMPLYEVLPPGQQEPIQDTIQLRAAVFLSDPTKHIYINEVDQIRKDGSTVWTEIVTRYYMSPETGKVEVNGVTRNISERKRTEEVLREANQHLQVQIAEIQQLQSQLHEQATHDVLTGLFNRRYMQEILDQSLAHAARELSLVSVMMIDIDHFKRINDVHGHMAGDLMLQAMGALLSSHTRQMDTACRYGGEEFVVIMTTAALDTAMQRADELRQAFANLRVEYEGHELRATISVGVATFPKHGNNSDALLRAADQALYMAKATGRNCVYAADTDLAAADRLLTTD
jgi:diguanylate cyclase (GGDEF)-like protein/PAS domain S-box-containing protein